MNRRLKVALIATGFFMLPEAIAAAIALYLILKK